MSGTILIVEDEILVGMMMKKKIEECGYHVAEIVTSGADAVIAAEALRPDVLLMDVSLQGPLDGVEFAKEIRTTQSIPVIFFTGNHLDGDLRQMSAEVHPIAILDKMGPFSEVIRAIEKALAT